MSLYKVKWLEEAENQLADIWIAAGDRAAVTAADQRIEFLLARDPLQVGTPLAEG